MSGGFKMHGRVRVAGIPGCYILRMADPVGVPAADRRHHACWEQKAAEGEGQWGAVLSTSVTPAAYVASGQAAAAAALPADLAHLQAGDIIRLNTAGNSLNVMYKRASRFNSLLVTERCNSNCLMCSQPPKARNDDYLIDELLQAVPLMSPETPELGITGGEPTRLGDRLLTLIEAIGRQLPDTSLHLLSNGRLFKYLGLAHDLSRVQPTDFMVGVPLYSDLPWEHDFVVQADGAFEDTILGLLNLARCNVRIELRVVIHQQTFGRLPMLGRFIARNLPFVSHVALMGLENTRHTPMNHGALWVDPLDYQRELALCVRELTLRQVPVKIFNHQLCVLDERLWPLAVQSISDWKNVYLPECDHCDTRARCGGFFASGTSCVSRGIHALETASAAAASPPS